eukprot:4463071-Prorocentrum_lima.AAC.1
MCPLGAWVQDLPTGSDKALISRRSHRPYALTTRDFAEDAKNSKRFIDRFWQWQELVDLILVTRRASPSCGYQRTTRRLRRGGAARRGSASP